MFKSTEKIDTMMQIHSIISIEISRAIRLDLYGSDGRKPVLKHALGIIDQLDWLLESPSSNEDSYANAYQALFELLEKLKMEKVIIKTIYEKYGPNIFTANNSIPPMSA